VSAIDDDKGRRRIRGDERHIDAADRYVHPDIEGDDTVSTLRAPTDAMSPAGGAPSTSSPDEPPAADEEHTVSTIDIEGTVITSCRSRPNRC
jgi:hypothetical protein